MKRDEIIQYLRENRGWILQYAHGISGKGWWWLRNTNSPSETINLDGRSAQAARALLKHEGVIRFGVTNYVLR